MRSDEPTGVSLDNIDRINDEVSNEQVLLLDVHVQQDEHAHSSGIDQLMTKDAELDSSLWSLFFLHGGFSQALPTTALMYIINTRVEVPVFMLPTYAALAFLPFSLKPLYAYLDSWSSSNVGRHVQLSGLLILHAFMFAGTALVPRNGVLVFMVLSFFRGVAMAWPEFLLGLSLVDQAHEIAEREAQNESLVTYEEAAARMQAQAATARNTGSIAAHIVAFLLFAARWLMHSTRNLSSEDLEMNQELATILFILTCLSSVVAALIAYWFKVGTSTILDHSISSSGPEETEDSEESAASSIVTSSTSYQSFGSIASEENASDIEHVSVDEGQRPQPPQSSSLLNKEAWLVIMLQLIVILLALRWPITQQFTSWVGECFWYGYVMCFIVAVMLMVLILASNSFSWEQRHSVGLFLILRHSLPGAGFLMSSFRYSIFFGNPLWLQLLSLGDMVVTTGASWSYGRFFSRWSSGKSLTLLMAGTTVFASVAMLGHLWFVDATASFSSTGLLFGVAALTCALSTWTGEWSFLPDVVLATVALKMAPPQDQRTTDLDEMLLNPPSTTSQNDGSSNEQERIQAQKQRGIQYGAFITCIDFGDQLGALLTGSLVSAFHINRENEWDGLGHFIVLCSLLSVASLVLLALLR